MNQVMFKTFTYWPDGSWKEAPNDGFVYACVSDTYVWDGSLEVWVTGYGGKIIDFTPAGMPSKMYEIDEAPLQLDDARIMPTCECGAHKTPNPNCHATWCRDWVRS